MSLASDAADILRLDAGARGRRTRCTRPSASGSRPTATSTSGSSCCRRSAIPPRRRSASRCARTSRATSSPSSSSRSRISRRCSASPCRSSRSTTRSRAIRWPARARPAGAGRGRQPLAARRRRRLPQGPREDDGGGDRARSRRAALRLLPQHRLSRLSGEDFDGLFRQGRRRPTRLFPYVEFVKRDGAALAGAGAGRQRSLELLRAPSAASAERPIPIAAWRAALPRASRRLAARDMDYFHLYAFNLPRQLGANFEMLGTYLDWLGEHGAGRARRCGGRRRRIAEAPRPCSSSSRAWPTAARFDAGEAGARAARSGL